MIVSFIPSTPFLPPPFLYPSRDTGAKRARGDRLYMISQFQQTKGWRLPYNYTATITVLLEGQTRNIISKHRLRSLRTSWWRARERLVSGGGGRGRTGEILCQGLETVSGGNKITGANLFWGEGGEVDGRCCWTGTMATSQFDHTKTFGWWPGIASGQFVSGANSEAQFMTSTQTQCYRRENS